MHESTDRQAYVAAVLASVGLCPRGTRHVEHQKNRRCGTRCSGCRRPRDRGPKQRYCKACHAEHARRTRPKHSELDPAARKRANCRRLTNMLVTRGKMAKTACRCGATDVTARHRNYDDPWDVSWECRRCRTTTTTQIAAA